MDRGWKGRGAARLAGARRAGAFLAADLRAGAFRVGGFLAERFLVPLPVFRRIALMSVLLDLYLPLAVTGIPIRLARARRTMTVDAWRR